MNCQTQNTEPRTNSRRVGRPVWPRDWIAPLAVLVVLIVVSAGCQNGPFAPGQQAAWQQGQVGTQVGQVQDLQRRVTELDRNNRDLHAELARWKQQAEVHRDRLELTQQRLTEAADQLRQMQLSEQEVKRQFAALQASARRGGGAQITANNSLRNKLRLVQLPGIEVREEGDVVRLELPTSQLFGGASNRLLPAAATMLDRVADVIASNYRRNRIGIEGHSDSAPLAGGISHHQLTTAQAQAVFQQLTTRNRLPTAQLFVVGHGANHPRASNAASAGRQRNQRIELVVYPEEY